MSYQSSRVLVTGAGGFIGSHLVEALARRGVFVRAFVSYNSQNTPGWLAELPKELLPSVEITAGDIRDARQVQSAVEGCKAVFHLAALISIPYSYQAPESYIETNVRGTFNVVESARRCGGVKVIHTSTSEVYGTPRTIPITEQHPLKAQSPYAASKIAADKLVESYYHTHGIPAVILRPFNTYGPRQSVRAVLPAMLSQMLAGKTRIELGALWPRRDLTYVDDTVRGFLAAGQQDAAIGQTIHLGTGQDISIGELAELAREVVGSTAEIVSTAERMRPENSEVRRLLSSPEKARRLLRWEPRVSLAEGLQHTAKWISSNLHRFDPDTYSI